LAASNRNLDEEIAEKRFREDLYYRLGVLPIKIPPLRERKGDIKAIVMENKRHLKGKNLSTDFWDLMLRYDWPGNVRELIHVIKRAGIYVGGSVIGKEIGDVIKASFGDNDDKTSGRLNEIWNMLKSGESFWDIVKRPFLDRELNRSEVKSIILRGLSESDGKYKNSLKIFNISEGEYKNFMRFLYDNRLK
jgi:transcriptional regulator with PAS, ATPase and Fis domain